MKVSSRLPLFDNDLEEPTGFFSNRLFVVCALADHFANEPIDTYCINIATYCTRTGTSSFFSQFFFFVQTSTIERRQFHNQSWNNTIEVHVNCLTRRRRNTGESIGMTNRQRSFQHPWNDVRQQLPASDAQYTSHTVESTSFGDIILTFHRHEEGWHNFVECTSTNNLEQTLEALSRHFSNLIILIAQCILHHFDKNVEEFNDLLFAGRCDDFRETDTHSLPSVLVSPI
mmetsp:Transcript_25360/g.38307  ORF Transcript_25360/g.38307 Transcript_25360/m.38307 type:complete len:229 (-) Transcript_25360:996-1682(-)